LGGGSNGGLGSGGHGSGGLGSGNGPWDGGGNGDNPILDFIGDHWREILNTGVPLLTYAGCMALSGGLGAAGCSTVAGGVGGAINGAFGHCGAGHSATECIAGILGGGLAGAGAARLGVRIGGSGLFGSSPLGRVGTAAGAGFTEGFALELGGQWLAGDDVDLGRAVTAGAFGAGFAGLGAASNLVRRPRAIPTTHSPYQVHIDPRTRRGPMAIDTSGFKGPSTANGGVRNRQAFWGEWSAAYPETLSDANRSLIARPRPSSPLVDDQWIEHFPEAAANRGEMLVHHHLDCGPMAIPLPQSVHGFAPGYGIWHAYC
jgi:hypothetical protein